MSESSPFLINVMASSLDGRIGMHHREGDGERGELGLTSEADQKFLREQIASADAIIVGASSIRANGECFDAKARLGRYPLWIICAEQPLEENLAFWEQTHIPRLLLVPKPLPIKPGSGVEQIVCAAPNLVDETLNILKLRNLNTALLFGGGVVNRWFYEKQVVDELRLSLAPLVIGKANAPYLIAPPLPSPLHFLLLASHSEESFVFLRYKVLRSKP